MTGDEELEKHIKKYNLDNDQVEDDMSNIIEDEYEAHEVPDDIYSLFIHAIESKITLINLLLVNTYKIYLKIPDSDIMKKDLRVYLKKLKRESLKTLSEYNSIIGDL